VAVCKIVCPKTGKFISIFFFLWGLSGQEISDKELEPATIGKKKENDKKNRFVNIYPCK